MEDGTEASWNRFLNIASTLLGSRTFYAALGNNDRVVGDPSTPSTYFLNYFNFPNNEQWYSVNSGNLHIVVLDSAFSAANPSQTAWLSSDLQSANSQSRITVVMFHHPTFATTIQSYLQNYGVDFVVAGHIHTYSKSTVGSATMFTLPGGTAIGHATAQVFNNYAIFKAYNINGSLIETTTVNER
jgi:predicted MPP superfamily phosphohydrolase